MNSIDVKYYGIIQTTDDQLLSSMYNTYDRRTVVNKP